MVGSLTIRDGGVTVAFDILSNPGKHRILFPVSVAVLSPSRHGWPGSEPMIAQSFRLEQPTSSLSLLSTVAPVVISQSCPHSRCQIGQMSALSQAGVLPFCVLFSRWPQLPHLSCLPMAPLRFSFSLPLSVPQIGKTCGSCQGHIDIRKPPSSTLG